MSKLAQCYYRLGETHIGYRAGRAALAAVRRLGGLRRFHTALDALNLPERAARELMRLWQRMHWSSGDGMMPPQELLAVYALAYAAPVAGDIVELGSWTGLTTCYLAAACTARGCGRVHAVDTFAGTKEFGQQYASIAHYSGSTRIAFDRQVARSGLESVVYAWPGLTTEIAPRYDGAPIAFLLIDADHSYEGVKGDFEAWSPLVATGGVIAFHDYAMPDAGVREYVQAEIIGRSGYETHASPLPANLFAVTKSAVQPHQTQTAAPTATDPAKHR